MARIDVYDVIVIIFYFVAIVVVTLFSMVNSNRNSISGYFLAGRFMTWLPIGASLFASNIGSEHFIGLAGSGAAAGIGVGAFELNATVLLQLLGWFFLPVYIASKVCTLPEYMSKRFGGNRIRIYLSVLSLMLYIFTKISVNLYSGSIFINEAVSWGIYPSIIAILAVTAFTTIGGGLTAVIYTDTLQTFIMVLGGVIVMIRAFAEVGGVSGLYEKWFSTASMSAATLMSNSTCGYPSEKGFILLRSINDPDMPWLGFIFGQTPASIWYWCADQMMVQRALSAKNLSHAQGATLFAGFIKLLPMFMMVIPGMISRVLYPNEIACSTAEECMKACGSAVSCTNLAYPKLVLGLLPPGLRGLMLAVMLAALMSDLTSIFNSASTLFTVDLYSLVRKQAKNNELMIVGRLFVVVMIVVSILWIPMIESMQGGQLFIYIQSISAYLSPPIPAVYIVGMVWKRANEKGTFFALCVGFVIGVIRMVIDFVFLPPQCGQIDSRPSFLINFHYMYFAMMLFVLTIVVMIVVSLLTESPSSAMMQYTYKISEYHVPTIESHDCNLNEMQENKAETTTSQGSRFQCSLRWFLQFLCGLTDNEETVPNNPIASTKQSRNARILLNSLLIVLLAIALFLYVFLSLFLKDIYPAKPIVLN